MESFAAKRTIETLHRRWQLISMRVHLRVRTRLSGLGMALGSAAPESPTAACPECGTTRLKKLTKPDRIDRVSGLPWSKIHRFFGGRLYHCLFCRLQFYDCRRQDRVEN